MKKGIYKFLITLNLFTLLFSVNAAQESSLPKRYIKKLNRQVSFLGLGTVELGRDWGIGGNEKSLHPSEKRTKEVLQAAIKHGINVIDTASSYHLSEERIGRYIPQQKYQYLLISKPGEHNIRADDRRCEQATYDYIYCRKPGAAYDFSKAAIFKDVENSLRKLKVKTLDVALLHLQNETAMDVLKKGEAIAALKELRQAGKVRFIGVSVNGPAAKYAVMHTDIDIIELEYNLLNQRNESAIRLAHEKGMGVIVRGGLGTGLLTPYVAKHIHDPKLPYGPQLRSLIKLVNHDYEKLTALALHFLYQNPHISTVIVGADQAKFIAKDIAILQQFHDDKLLAKAKKLLAKHKAPSDFTEMMGEFYQ